MRVVIRGEAQDINVTSVVLDNNPLEPNMMSLFHCPKCGTSILQHGGDAVFICPGTDRVSLPIIVQCRQCKKRYSFVSMV